MLDPMFLIPKDELLSLIVDAEREIARLQAVQIRALAAAAVVDDSDESIPLEILDKEYVREELAAAAHWSPSTAAARLHEAETLVERLPGTLRLLGAGRISYAHARGLAEVVQRCALDEAGAFELETRVLERAPEQTAAELRRCARRAAAAIDPRGAEEQHEDAVEQRRVCVQPDEFGMAWLHAYIPAADAQAVWLATQAGADKLPKDCRTTDQRRADAFVAIFTDVLTGQPGDSSVELPRQHGRRTCVQVSVALSTLLGLDEQPGELDGYGPVPAALARRIAADPTGTWHRLVTDERGRLIDYGRTRYKPPQDLIDHITARDRTCRAPGCNRTARRSEQDHIIAWADGGPTNADNLQALCSRHHHLKHDTDWTIQRLDTGITRWTTPAGRTHDKVPETYPIDQTRPLIGDDPAPF